MPHTASLFYDHTFHLFAGSRLVLHGDVRWRSPYLVGGVSQFQLNTPAIYNAIKPYLQTRNEFVSNLNASWTSAGGMYSMTGWVRNVFDNDYKTNANVGGVTSAATLSTTIPQITSGPYDPRSYGVSVNVRW